MQHATELIILINSILDLAVTLTGIAARASASRAATASSDAAEHGGT